MMNISNNWLNQIHLSTKELNCSDPTNGRYNKFLQNIVEHQNEDESAFYLCNISDIIRKYDNWMAKLPNITPHYAVKCNDSEAVLQTLALLGTGFDCASKEEISKVLAMGVHPDRIIFAHTCKPPSHIVYAASQGVKRMTFDNMQELHKIKRLCPDARLVLRIKQDSANAQFKLGLKFGCDHQTEAPALLKLAKSLDLNVVGVSFHVGSGGAEPDAFKLAIEAARHVFDCAAAVGYRMTFLDIGGGYSGENLQQLDEVAETITSSIKKHFPEGDIEIISEPGRYFVTSAYTLICNVHSLKAFSKIDTKTGQSVEHRMYYINSGVYGGFMDVVFDGMTVQPIPLFKDRSSNTKYYPTTLWGQTCDSLDKIIEDLVMPELELGDWLQFNNMGAYTISLSTNFNGFMQAKQYLMATEKDWELLKNKIISNKITNNGLMVKRRTRTISEKSMKSASKHILFNHVTNYFLRMLNASVTV